MTGLLLGLAVVAAVLALAFGAFMAFVLLYNWAYERISDWRLPAEERAGRSARARLERRIRRA